MTEYKGILVVDLISQGNGYDLYLSQDGIIGYRALISLEKGDQLTIFDKDSGETLWFGIINREPATTAALYDGWKWPVGWDPQAWRQLFDEGHRGLLIKNK